MQLDTAVIKEMIKECSTNGWVMHTKRLAAASAAVCTTTGPLRNERIYEGSAQARGLSADTPESAIHYVCASSY